MDRVIKFRGKCSETYTGYLNQWIYGGYTKGKKGQSYILDGTMQLKVYSETVEQFTGFKDIDGKEIFEGDIIQHAKYPAGILIVFFDDNVATFAVKEPKQPLSEKIFANYKVIGNIHDNPGLCENLRGCEVQNDNR